MKILSWISVIVLFFSFWSGSLAYCEGLFTCEDTPYTDPDFEQNLLSSQYHLLQLFGETSYRTTNFFKDDYGETVTWLENRIFFPRFSEFINTSIPLPDPFFIQILKYVPDMDWEDRWDYGVGIEWRPFKKAESFHNRVLSWIRHVRFYSVYLLTKRFQDKDEWSWRPDDDLRIGAELYRECNLYNERLYWAEFWTDGSWRATNFYIDDYNSWTFAIVPKVGIKFFPENEWALMPYLTGEIALTGRSEYWQNRMLAGIGIRVMPFRWYDGIISTFIRGIRIYAENLWIIHYFDDLPLCSECIPEDDLRIGINYTINWW